MESVEYKIVRKLKNSPEGEIYFPDDFLDSGSYDAVRQALVRLEDEDELIRLAHGIYLYPKEDPQLGILYPSIDKIAEAIAKRDKATIKPAGALAMNKLGLTTQVPMNAVYLTDGSARSIQVGNRKIKFKRTVPKNVAARGEISGLVIQVLREIGQDNVTEKELMKIGEQLKKEDPDHLKHDAKLAPAWIRKIMLNTMEHS